MLLLGAQRKWKALRKLDATAQLYIPPGGIPWGDAVGWPDVTGGQQARPTHSWAAGRGGVPTAAAGSDLRRGEAAAARRHRERV